MYFPRHAKKDCVLIQDAFRLNGLTKLHVKHVAEKNALKERKNAKRKNKSFRMFPAPETATNVLQPHIDRKSLATTTASTATAPQMPHRAHEKGNRYNPIHGKTGR